MGGGEVTLGGRDFTVKSLLDYIFPPSEAVLRSKAHLGVLGWEGIMFDVGLSEQGLRTGRAGELSFPET